MKTKVLFSLSLIVFAVSTLAPFAAKALVKERGCVEIRWSSSCGTCAMEGEIYCAVCD